MVLNYDSEIKSLDNCPSENDERTLKLYRIALTDPMTKADLKPLAILQNESWGRECRAWGLSFHSSLDGSKNAFKILNKKKKRKLIVYSLVVEKDLAVKHQSSNDKLHYTVYPCKGIDVLSKFIPEII